MDQEAIIQYITDTFTGVEVLRPTDGPGAGDTFIFYDPQHNLDPTHRMPFATIVTKDYGDFDNTSHLDRPRCVPAQHRRQQGHVSRALWPCARCGE